MSADSQILITLREYCRALQERETLVAQSRPSHPVDYQNELCRIDMLTAEIARRQRVLQAWARGESPIMAALCDVSA